MNNPIETISSMYFELQEVKRRLNDLTKLEHFKTILTEGEQTSINEIIEQCEIKSGFIKQVQSQLEYFPT